MADTGEKVRARLEAVPFGAPAAEMKRIFDRDGVTVHSKYLLIRARYAAGDEVETLVLAGSHNYTRGALESNDEALMRLNDAASYNAFLAHWNRMRAALP